MTARVFLHGHARAADGDGVAHLQRQGLVLEVEQRPQVHRQRLIAGVDLQVEAAVRAPAMPPGMVAAAVTGPVLIVAPATSLYRIEGHHGALDGLHSRGVVYARPPLAPLGEGGGGHGEEADHRE